MMVVLQKDDENCFYCMYVAVPYAADIFHNMCIPALHVDRTFFKTGLYDGVLVLIVATNDNGSILLLAAAWVPIKDTQNMLFVPNMLEWSGFNITNYPIFTHRGKLLSATTSLARDENVIISLKYCLEYIICNIKAK